MAVSRRGTLGPMTNCWESITAWTAGRISSLIARYCATRSRSGTFTTPVSESRATKLSDAAGLGNRAQGAVRLLVAGAAHGARRLPRRHGEALAALAHPAHATGRHAHHERVRRDVGRHDGTGADERVLAECDAAHDGGVRADRRPPLHEGGAILVLARHVAAGVHHVGENARRPAEHIVLEGDALVDRHVVLDLHVVADARAGHDHDVLAEAAALADDGAGHDVAKMPDLGILADAGAGVDVARFVDEGVRHLADHLDLELELDPGLLDDRLPHVVDGLEHVAGGGIARIDDIVRVQRRHLGAADREALQAAPAFMYTPPPTVPGMPMKRSTPANPASAVRRARSGVARPAPTIAVAPFISKRSSPFPMRITTPGKPASFTSTFDPSPRASHGSPRSCARSSALATSSGSAGITKKRAGPPSRYVV